MSSNILRFLSDGAADDEHDQVVRDNTKKLYYYKRDSHEFSERLPNRADVQRIVSLVNSPFRVCILVQRVFRSWYNKNWKDAETAPLAVNPIKLLAYAAYSMHRSFKA